MVYLYWARMKSVCQWITGHAPASGPGTTWRKSIWDSKDRRHPGRSRSVGSGQSKWVLMTSLNASESLTMTGARINTTCRNVYTYEYHSRLLSCLIFPFPCGIRFLSYKKVTAGFLTASRASLISQIFYQLKLEWCAGRNTRFAIMNVAPQRRFGRLLVSKLTISQVQSVASVVIWDRLRGFTMVMYGISGRTIHKARSRTFQNGLLRKDTCFAGDQLIGPIGALPDTACLMACTAIVHVSKSGLHTSIQERQLHDDQGHVFHIYRKGPGMKVFFGPLS